MRKLDLEYALTKETSNEPGHRLATPHSRASSRSTTPSTRRVHRFVLLLALAEQLGMSRRWIGYWFLFATGRAVTPGIGIMRPTSEVSEYYVAGRRVPAFSTAGDRRGLDERRLVHRHGGHAVPWAGYERPRWVMGWTGGYCLVALFLAPYLRKFGQFTIPDFLAERTAATSWHHRHRLGDTCSFVYVVAQIYGVGLIHQPLHGPEFGIGVFEASAASWSARCLAACGRSPGRKWRNTSS